MKFPESWPQTDEGVLTCLSCHVPGHEEDREIPLLLRDGPYPKMSSFCRMCHPESRRGARDAHLEANLSQSEGCGTCHEKTPVPGKDTAQTVTFSVRVTIQCLMCHDYEPHPAGQDHCMPRPGVRAVAIPTTFTILDEQITCPSCHNPHIQENEGGKLRDTVIGLEICLQCHQM